MTWAAPWAWALAAGVLLPVIAHLWSRRRPRAVAFPTLRFLRETSPVSRRLRRVQDWPLLLLRAMCVLAVVAAAAGPTLLTPGRAEAWRARLHRVIVVDTRVADAASAVVSRLKDEAHTSAVVGGRTAGMLMPSAVADAQRREGQRVEVAIVWDGSHAALAAADLAAIPAGAGVRLEVVDAGPAPAPRFAGHAGDGLPVTVETAAEDVQARALIELLLREHAAAIPFDELSEKKPPSRVQVWWPGATTLPAPGEATAVLPDLRAAIDRLAGDLRVREAAERSSLDPRARTDGGLRARGRILARDPEGVPLLWGWPRPDGIALVLHATPTSPLAYWSIFAALEALADPVSWSASREGFGWMVAERTAATRAPSAPTGAPLPGGLDTRVAWAVVLVLLVIEEVWCRRAVVPDDAEIRDAA